MMTSEGSLILPGSIDKGIALSEEEGYTFNDHLPHN
jgi:hypothetical protein